MWVDAVLTYMEHNLQTFLGARALPAARPEWVKLPCPLVNAEPA